MLKSTEEQYLEWASDVKLKPLFDSKYFIYHLIFSNYVEDGLFLLQKHDKNLEKYFKDNGISLDDDIEKIIRKLLRFNSSLDSIADNILVILDYLKWSYGINVNYAKINILKYKKNIQENTPKNKNEADKKYNSLPALRKALIEKYKQCQICGICNNRLLRQSHLKPKHISKKEGTIAEIFDINNVLLLCCNHDYLIDKGLITFDTEGNIIISKELCNEDNEDIEKLELNKNIKIVLEEKQKKYIKYHQENIFEKKHSKKNI
ncbi:hypothetical protein CDLVIII_3179 [Clostridium sp. DL-VIII]|uniref:HNH endonuclease n=1 Tax=Clostridium sp. DL-VIII TaxID=641107 RepID=UPI00023AFFBA|nr:HNH endonuclease [Clostridium sp. DL-VIII]EHI99755.1 hypothetical protein CDLVIII_3179 [Clostridium sp. DL-VIII]